MKPVLLLLFLFYLSSFGWAQEDAGGPSPAPKSSITAGAKEENTPLLESEEKPPQEMVYSFLQGFPDAQAQKLKKGKLVNGRWLENGFQFEDSLATTKNIVTSDQIEVNGRRREAIWFLVTPGFEFSLVFSNVSPGRRLRIFYAMPDETFLVKQPAFVQVEVQIGKKKIFETQINTKGWKEKIVHLTLPFLLHRNYVVSIKVRSLDPDPKLFGFYGYIE